MKDNFLKNMFHDLNDISHGTDDEVTAELEAMGVDVEGAKKRFEETIKKCRAKATFNIRLDDEQLKSIAEKMDRLKASENSARVRLSYVEAELATWKKESEYFEKRCRKAEDKVHEIRMDSLTVNRCIATKQERDAAKRIIEATKEGDDE